MKARRGAARILAAATGLGLLVAVALDASWGQPVGGGESGSGAVTESIYLDSKGRPAGKGDVAQPVSEAYRQGQGWHPMALQSQSLPKDRFGLVDWAQAVTKRAIDPKPGLDPAVQEPPPLDIEVVIPTRSDFLDDVVFPHAIHTWWLGCESCHPRLFVPGRGANRMSMAEMTQGKWCGACHNRVAFPLTDCARCHVKPKGPTAG